MSSTVALDELSVALIDGVPRVVVKATGKEYAAPATAGAAAGREKTRLTKESGERVASDGGGSLGGPFTPQEDPAFLAARGVVFDEIAAAQRARIARKERVAITVTLPDGRAVEGVAWETTPLSIAEGISKGLAGSVVVAKVAYSRRVGIEAADGQGMVNTGPEEEDEGAAPGAAAPGELWDLTRPLEGDCTLALLKFEDKEGRAVFWHSSAHVLGECLECKYGSKLCIGPPTEEGFYYDAYMGSHTLAESDYPAIKAKAEVVCKAKQPFERLVLTKAEALRLFADNPFKVALITAKIPEDGYTTAYRCGPLIDLCRGPHVPSTGAIKAFEVTKTSSAYWLGSVDNDTLQRVYGVSFPDAKLMKAHLTMVEEAKKRDHRLVGAKQELFFFHDLSPGACFFQPHGARIYNRLQDHIRTQYRTRGFHEVVTPNVFNLDLWRISGHADHYLEHMFTFPVEGSDYGLKPMNCPGHCLMFDHRVRSYRELPLRLADFGVLHRNEFSGALTGLTRVRRFQQDDAHIFCRPDQITAEVAAALEFMQAVYGVFGFSFELDLSTRPKKALGSLQLWAKAEAMMKEALDTFGRPWRINPGDGAFYGPKIDIKVFDALGRRHQCATIQLDFQLPVRFNLRYKARSAADDAADAAAEGEGGDDAGEGAAAPQAAVAVEAGPVLDAAALKEKRAAEKKERGAKKAAEAAAARAAGGAVQPADDAAAATSEEVPEAAVPVEAPVAPSGGSRGQFDAMVERARSGVDEVPDGFERPVIIHRAILGSVERFMAVLTEHTGGKWPFWISPRQVAVIPVAAAYTDYANACAAELHAAGFFVDVDASSHTLNKKVREAQVAQYNFICVVGAEEAAAGSVAVRTRDNLRHGTKPLAAFIADLNALVATHQ